MTQRSAVTFRASAEVMAAINAYAAKEFCKRGEAGGNFRTRRCQIGRGIGRTVEVHAPEGKERGGRSCDEGNASGPASQDSFDGR